MSTGRDRFVLSATVLLESAWLFAVLSLAGLLFGLSGSPLGWPAVLAILTASFVVARMLQLFAMPTAMGYGLQMVAGVCTLYLTLATQVDVTSPTLDLGWVGNLESTGGADGPRKAFLGGLLGVGLWWRGGRLASSDIPVDELANSFRTGIVGLGIAALVDVFHSADLKVFPLMFLFFASGLAGLSIGHIVPASQQSVQRGAWLRVIGGVVSVVLVAGLLFSLVQVGLPTFLTIPILWGVGALAIVFFFVFIIPVAYLIHWAFIAVLALLDLFGFGVDGGEPTQAPVDFGETLRRAREGADGPSAIFQALEWTLAAIAVTVLLYFLARAFRRRVRWRRLDPDMTRESVMEDADPAYDFAKLLLNLLPRRFKTVKEEIRQFRLPDDESGVVDVFRLYFGLVSMAQKRGLARSPSQTPDEYRETLGRAFPPNLVNELTAAFNRACYGHHAALPERIEEMRAAVDRLATDASAHPGPATS